MRATIRDALPMPVRQLLRASHSYAYRVMLWRTIMREVHGVSEADRAVLRRSALAAPWTSRHHLTRWRDPVLLADAEVEVAGVGRFAVRARTDELWMVLPARERALVATMRRILRPGGVFVDAGANIGAATVLGRRLVGAEGRVVAIEMMPETAARLRANLALNGYHDVTMAETALAREAGLTVTAAIQPGHAGRATLALADQLETPRTLALTTRTLADLLGELPSIDLLKLDLEGYELDALIGAEPVLARIHAIVFEELEGDAASAWLAARGFVATRLDSCNRLAQRRGA